MFVNGDFDRATQFDFLKRLDDVTERSGTDRAPQRFRVAVPGQENDRNVRALLDHVRRLDAIDFTAQADIHDDELRL